MFPWKMIFRFFSAVVLFATGGFAAGHDLPLPFDVAPTEAAAPAAPDTTTTTAPAVDESTTTTTTAPDAGVPVVEPVPVPEPTTTTTAPAPTTTTGKPVKAKAPVAVPVDPADAPPVAPVDGDAPPVCAAAAAKVCGPAERAPAAGDNSHAARVQRCQDWWNSLAQAFEQHNRPEWAARARKIADRCEAMITRWEEAQQRWEERRKDKEKGDHNDDDRPDNGWHNRDGRDGDEPKEPKADISRHREGRH